MMSYRGRLAHATLGGVAWILLCLICMTQAVSAAENLTSVSAHCRQLRAEAESTAWVLRAPRVEVDAVRPPKVGDISGTGIVPGGEFQLRTVIAYPALDLFRGNSVLNAADAECARTLAAAEAEAILEQGTSFGQATALRVQIDVLTAGLPRIDELLAETQRRLDRGIITVMERDELQLRRLRFESSLGDLRHELAMLESQSPAADGSALGPALRRYEESAIAVQGERSFVRRLDPWRVDLQLGGIPYPQPDWYGMVAVSYNLGGFAQPRAEAAALAAGKEDLRTNRTELRARSERFTAAMRDSATQLGNDLALVDRQLAFIQQRLQSPEAESDRLRQTLASFEVERIELQGRRAYLEKLHTLRVAAGRTLE